MYLYVSVFIKANSKPQIFRDYFWKIKMERNIWVRIQMFDFRL